MNQRLPRCKARALTIAATLFALVAGTFGVAPAGAQALCVIETPLNPAVEVPHPAESLLLHEVGSECLVTDGSPGGPTACGVDIVQTLDAIFVGVITDCPD